MGKHARIAELEQQIAGLRERLAHAMHSEALLEQIASVPFMDGATVVYDYYGQRVQFDMGAAIRALLNPRGH